LASSQTGKTYLNNLALLCKQNSLNILAEGPLLIKAAWFAHCSKL
jgi:hypothetical protein